MSDLVNYKDYLHIFNHTTQTYDLVHKGTGVVLKANQPMPVKRAHTEYDPLIADMIVDKLLNGTRLSAIVQEQGMPSAGVIAVWLKHNPVFKANIEMAREYAAETYHDKVLDIADLAMNADKSEVPGLKLAADSYKWAAEKGSERFAKRKEEGNNGSASITINLRTGVHEARISEDLIVDEYGNFKGFKNGSSESWGSEESLATERRIEDIELGTDRFTIVRDE